MPGPGVAAATKPAQAQADPPPPPQRRALTRALATLPAPIRRPDPPGEPRGPLGSATLRLRDPGLWIFFPSLAAPGRSPGAVSLGRRRGGRPVARPSVESWKP